MLDPGEVEAFLRRVRAAIAASQLVFDPKSEGEIRDIGWSSSQALDVLLELEADDYDRSEWSRFHGNVHLHNFMPAHDDGELFIRLYAKAGVVCVSFHWA